MSDNAAITVPVMWRRGNRPGPSFIAAVRIDFRKVALNPDSRVFTSSIRSSGNSPSENVQPFDVPIFSLPHFPGHCLSENVPCLEGAR